MRDIGKRGQVAIFVIVAVVIVAAILVFVLFRPGTEGIFQEERFNPNSFLKECIEPNVRERVDLLAKQGGYSDPKGYITYEGDRIKYLCYTGDNYETCVVQQPMIKNHFEKELNEIVRTRSNECTRELISEYENRGYEVSSSTINSEVSIIPGKILVEVRAPMTITKETSQTFNSFEAEIESEMYDLLFTASSIIDFESELGDSASELYLQYYPNLRIEKNKLSGGTTIYTLENVISGESFRFASRSLAWPAGYGLE